MSDAMIWTFGILLFVFLFMLASIWFLRTAMREGLPKQTPSGVSRKDLTALTGGLDDIKTRLTNIEEILKSVE